MKQVYQAKDGKIFNTKKECIEYEENISIIMLDTDNNILDFNENNICYDSYYMYIENEKNLDIIKTKGKELSTLVPLDIGYWCRTSVIYEWISQIEYNMKVHDDTYNKKWIPIDKVIDDLTTKINFLNAIKRKIDKQIKEK